MSDNPNHLLWCERTYECEWPGGRKGNARSGYPLPPKTDIHPYNSDANLGPLEDADWSAPLEPDSLKLVI